MASQRKTALITGGNRGIGYAICKGLLKADFDVILAARSQSKAQTAAEQLHPDIQVLELDVANDNSIQKAAKTLAQKIECLDVLINNAGIYPDMGVDILTISRDLLEQTMNINAFGPVKIAQAFLPLLEKADNAKVINISSGYGALNGLSAAVPSYCLSKLTLNGATIMLANALRPKQIGVYAMSPGWVATDMGGESAPRSPEQGADTAIWLATEATLAMTGKFFSDRKTIPY
ncbi:MAG: SDR family NAD(P)-dependent oxidoreductase [Cyanobacteria bacterium P01_A01_bin.17]